MLLHVYLWGSVSFMLFCRIARADADDSLGYRTAVATLFTSSLAMTLAPCIWGSPAAWPEVMAGFGLFCYLLATSMRKRGTGTICSPRPR